MFERKLSGNPELKSFMISSYMNIFTLDIFIRSVTRALFHAIFRLEIDANNIRVVFDVSARGFRGPSLNQSISRS